ncbi:response regulator [Roseicyclus persicicus]|uniref:Response regulator transcription factor n=1 Tax=Roseicyclus persicicus TaxID=2650661 RepID=A0A7X6GY75_9RHOB|nr:response regulator transcription factor [Roseibacterium persicicum]
MRIVVVEDNAALAKGISYRLQDLGHGVDWLCDGDQADAFLRQEGSDLLILDINLPGADGLTVLRNLRARGDERPVLILTARAETEHRVRGLDAGADDYLVKPFEMDELEARVRALTRRSPRPIRRVLSFGPVSLDCDARQVAIAGVPLDLPRREVSLLEKLLTAQGRAVSKQDLLDHIYGTGADVEEAAVEVHISRLRKRLRPHGLSIRVQRGIGYSLAEAAAGAA